MSLFTTDQDGFLQNSGSYDLIQPDFRPLLVQAAALCRDLVGTRLLSLYVRGSVAAGRAHLGSSDVDLVLLTKDGVPQFTVQPDKIAELSRAFSKVTSEVDLTVLPLEILRGAPEYARLRVYLQTQSVLLEGEDVRPELPRFRPNSELACYMHPKLEEELHQLSQLFTLGTAVERSYGGVLRPTRFWCVWTMRTVLRASGLLAMTQTGSYESDLAYCRDHARSIYPEMALSLQEAYRLALDPTDNPQLVESFLEHLLPILLPLWREAVRDEVR